MFQLISPLSKATVLLVSAGLTWSTVGTLAQGFQDSRHAAQPAYQLPMVVVVGHRAAAVAGNTATDGVQESTAQARLTKINPASKDTAI
jgi:hypothetical protein